MTVYVDADACPVVRIVEKAAREAETAVVLLCDTNHELSSVYSEVKVIGAGADALRKKTISVNMSFDQFNDPDLYGGSSHLSGKAVSILPTSNLRSQSA